MRLSVSEPTFPATLRHSTLSQPPKSLCGPASHRSELTNATQINERFLNLLDTARTLLGDFREVERHFRRVTEDLLVSRKSGDISRGQIVGQ
ncbi:MAG: hypothetical protein DME62_16035, partial [Verrucomicrobia bacterium]